MSTGFSSRQTAEPTPPASWRSGWSPAVRAIVSVLIVWHLAAVIFAPLSVPPTILSDYLRPIFRPYIAATYLDHGYKFFAPDPGPSHLVRYELILDDGTRASGEFPNLAEERPRLLYHRHFMLSEFINNLGLARMPMDQPPVVEAPGPTLEQPTMARGPQPPPLSDEQRIYARSYAQHLLADRDARTVTLFLREHLIPSPRQVIDGVALDHPDSYLERPLGTYTKDQP